jgi:YD repeat-containing protein
MLTTPIRELDHRTSDGIDVRLLWDSRTNRVSITVQDERTEEAFVLEVPGADAREAFMHPYAYALRGSHLDALAA